MWNWYNFYRYLPHNKTTFEFCRTSWLSNFFSKTGRGCKHPYIFPMILSVCLDLWNLHCAPLSSIDSFHSQDTVCALPAPPVMELRSYRRRPHPSDTRQYCQHPAILHTAQACVPVKVRTLYSFVAYNNFLSGCHTDIPLQSRSVTLSQ